LILRNYTNGRHPTNIDLRKVIECFVICLALAGVAYRAGAEEAANLLRNADFQDDWMTALPENQTLHWSYLPTFANRRDFNPDGWSLHGSWHWLDADEPAGGRRLIVEGPKAEIRQRVNWVAVNDDRKLEGFPDAGGFPNFAVVRSGAPVSVVRDLTFRVRLKGVDLPPDAAKIEIALAPPGNVSSGDPLGTLVSPTVTSATSVPAGNFDWRWFEVRLAARDWLAAAASTNAEQSNATLPATVAVTIRYQAPAGRIEIERAELTAAEPTAPNLLTNGGFEDADGDGTPSGWSRAEKYTYFPPGLYYLFNSWHNTGFANRGAPALDALIVHSGRRSLRMPLLAGDELAVSSAPIALNQKEARLIEASVWVKTDRVNEMQIDARDEKGGRLDGFDFISKAPSSIGTNEWRLVRQVFRPRDPVQSLTLVLAGRGANGYTLGGTSQQPQNNVAGTIWWDDARVFEPESSTADLAARGVKPIDAGTSSAALHLAQLDSGERLLGENRLSAIVANPGDAQRLALRWQITSASGRTTAFHSAVAEVPAQGEKRIELSYTLDETVAPPYRESRGTLSLERENGEPIASTEIPFAQWTVPIDLRLGALYLRPEQSQLVRLNLGLSRAAMTKLRAVRLEIIRKATNETVATQEVAATPAAIAAQRDRIPSALRGDFGNLLLADVDVSKLPVEPFVGAERRWFVRATAIGVDGKTIAAVDSAPFCRQAHDSAPDPVHSVAVRKNLLFVNDRPWMPWGGIYGFVPQYDGPADPGSGYRNLHELPEWSVYDGFTSKPYNRRDNDLDALRYVPASIADGKVRTEVERQWNEDRLYAATYFLGPPPGDFSWDALAAKAGGAERLEDALRFASRAPMIVSTGPGFEELFGAFHAATPDELRALESLVRSLREKTAKPVMVGHGGAWNRFELEKVPFFDIFDPETEPLYPADLHTDLWPLIAGHDQTIWLRPQLYESVPYERWRFHTFVELMRGARGWQMAHGPGDASLLRGLHGEVRLLEPAAYSSDPGPAIDISPPIEHWSRRAAGTTYLIAATTHAHTFGRWRWSDESSPYGRVRTSDASIPSPAAENALDRIAESAQPGWIVHGVDCLPSARRWKSGTKLVQWLRLDPADPPKGVALLVRAEARWSTAFQWGETQLDQVRGDATLGYWFLRHFHRNAVGFIGYDGKGLDRSLGYVPQGVRSVGALPAAGEWTKLEAEIPANTTVDGVAFLQRGGRVSWGRSSLHASDGGEEVLWGDTIGFPAEELRHARISVSGLPAGSNVRALFEDRTITAAAGYFEDDFRGQDLYQRHGGGDGYGDTPVALHVYEIP
jgi:hypothetical protein